jgi:hypothetical protein
LLFTPLLLPPLPLLQLLLLLLPLLPPPFQYFYLPLLSLPHFLLLFIHPYPILFVMTLAALQNNAAD